MSQLMQASGGGALGLFTAITRLKNIYQTLAPDLAKTNIPLYAQHIDAMNLNTLIQIFRAEPNSCLLGTDALRDGIDVPGEALRLIIFDRVPMAKTKYALQSTKPKIRTRNMDQPTNPHETTPSLRQTHPPRNRQRNIHNTRQQTTNKTNNSIPKTTPIIRCGLAEAIKETREFFK